MNYIFEDLEITPKDNLSSKEIDDVRDLHKRYKNLELGMNSGLFVMKKTKSYQFRSAIKLHDEMDSLRKLSEYYMKHYKNKIILIANKHLSTPQAEFSDFYMMVDNKLTFDDLEELNKIYSELFEKKPPNYTSDILLFSTSSSQFDFTVSAQIGKITNENLLKHESVLTTLIECLKNGLFNTFINMCDTEETDYTQVMETFHKLFARFSSDFKKDLKIYKAIKNTGEYVPNLLDFSDFNFFKSYDYCINAGAQETRNKIFTNRIKKLYNKYAKDAIVASFDNTKDMIRYIKNDVTLNKITKNINKTSIKYEIYHDYNNLILSQVCEIIRNGWNKYATDYFKTNLKMC